MCISQEPRRVPAPCVLLANMASLVQSPPQLRPARPAERARILEEKVCLWQAPSLSLLDTCVNLSITPDVCIVSNLPIIVINFCKPTPREAHTRSRTTGSSIHDRLLNLKIHSYIIVMCRDIKTCTELCVIKCVHISQAP